MTGNNFRRLLNVGCGRCYHNDWTNIDLVASGPGVRQYDLRRGIPCDDSSFDAVYHSHVLEHITPEGATPMLAECFRVLRPGGVIRVVVPNLEQIARVYLDSISEAESGTDVATANHHWMTLEMIDQLTRDHSGGKMGPAMRDANRINAEFIQHRIGGEMDPHPHAKVRKTTSQRLAKAFGRARHFAAMAACRLIAGKSGREAFREGSFRQSGEVHRWMYDRVSLANILHQVGFTNATVMTADESKIDDFNRYQLDHVGGRTRKPDSLFMEAIRPGEALEQSRSRAA